MESIKDDFVLEARNIIMEFSGVRVLDEVDFSLRRGEVHALLGENGAGKSTLVKILTGVYSKKAGKIFINGNEVNFKCPQDATAKGIGIIYQEFSQVPQLTVLENIFLGRTPKVRSLGGLIQHIDWSQMKKLGKEVMEELGFDINLDARVSSIGVAQQQLLEIIKSIILDSKILIMDEPTAALSSGEIDLLFELIKNLKNKGVSIIYISHRLDEIKRICDRATVLRNGKLVDTVEMGTTPIDDVIKMMIGKDLECLFTEKQNSITAETLLSVTNLSCEGKFKGINIKVNSGEIVGITGLVGAGKTEVLRAIFGADKDFSGGLCVKGKNTKVTSPIQAINNGIAFVTEDRKFQGLITKLSAEENIMLGNYKKIKSKFGIINLKKAFHTAEKYFDELNIRPLESKKKVRFFSGGNQQKIVISKWLCANADIYLFDEPTRGVDVGAKAEIYKLITSLAERGCGVIVASSEIPEILGLCDRILVMNKGQIIEEYSRQEANYDSILKIQAGG